MTEQEAQTWLHDKFGRASSMRLSDYASLLIAESKVQNLVAASTIGNLWARHIADSAQLIEYAHGAAGLWVDVGSGGGLPGLVVALIRSDPITLIEPRRLRADFLQRTAGTLCASNVEVLTCRCQQVKLPKPAAVISARAVATLASVFESACHLASEATTWIIPKGRSADAEVALARTTWHGAFHVEPSLTEADSGIIIARGVRPR